MDQLSKGILEQAKDPMCVPQLDPYDIDTGQTYAQKLKDYINFCVESDHIDTNDPTSIY